ncbi:DROUGHT INDUCED LIKE9-7, HYPERSENSITIVE TO RED AND BLUE [Hibiscus trionum]|uniref:DROUGHT INDUCED LIKE9-7, HYPERSENSITIVE TO RED AND BLUE n=1 Tax=Hibiscus trionum TaxID=183268 RepID=A0A9W7IT18_HIBTR|nr:DROUGHT INDUCED LIKE9-7, HYPERSENSITIVE TO RED AND BLUE [Hibiscus trionum]
MLPIQVCPVCAKRVGMDVVSHITMQHGNFLKVQRRRRLRKGGSNLTFSMLRKELREGNLHAVLAGSSCIVPPSNVEADPLLSSFMFNPPTADEPLSLQSLSIAESSAEKESADKEVLERKPQQLQLSDKEHEEKARRCEFVRELLMSTILDESL